MTTGVSVELPNKEKVLVKATVLSGVFDIPAKCDALGLVGHTGSMRVAGVASW